MLAKQNICVDFVYVWNTFLIHSVHLYRYKPIFSVLNMCNKCVSNNKQIELAKCLKCSRPPAVPAKRNSRAHWQTEHNNNNYNTTTAATKEAQQYYTIATERQQIKRILYKYSLCVYNHVSAMHAYLCTWHCKLQCTLLYLDSAKIFNEIYIKCNQSQNETTITQNARVTGHL